MSFEERVKKFENSDALENKSEKELSLLEIDELLKKSEKVSDNLDKFSKDEFYKKENFENSRVAVDKPDDRFDEEAYAKAGFWEKFKNFTRFGLNKERYGLIKSKERGLLDKTKINKDIAGKGFKIGQSEKQEREYLESNVIDIKGDFKKDKSERETVKAFGIDEVDGKIIKIVGSGRTEKGQIEAAGKMRETEISRLETVNSAELVGLKEAMERNAKSKESFLKLSESMSDEEREKVTAKLDEEENQMKEKIKEKEEKLSEETKKFHDPLEGRLQETLEIENSLMEAFDFIKAGESNLNKQIKECESFIKEAQKLDLLGGVGIDVVKIFEDKKAILDAQAKEFAEKKAFLSSKSDILENNKKEIEATLTRVNNIGKTKREIVEEKKSENKNETKTTEEKKDKKEDKGAWDKVRDETWGLADKEREETERQPHSPIKSSGGRSYIDKLFEHYDDSGFEETRKADDKKDEAKQKVETKKRKKARVADKPKDAKGTEAPKNTDRSGKTESGVTTQIETQEESSVVETDQAENVKFTDEEIEKIVMKELKTLGFMNNKKVAEKSKDGLTKHLIGAVKNEILKSPEKVTEKFIKNEVDDWYKRLTKNLNESGE